MKKKIKILGNVHKMKKNIDSIKKFNWVFYSKDELKTKETNNIKQKVDKLTDVIANIAFNNGAGLNSVQLNEIAEQIKIGIKKVIKERDQTLVSNISNYLAREHNHFSSEHKENFMFEDERPYVDSLEFEKFFINLIKSKI